MSNTVVGSFGAVFFGLWSLAFAAATGCNDQSQAVSPREISNYIQPFCACYTGQPPDTLRGVDLAQADLGFSELIPGPLTIVRPDRVEIVTRTSQTIAVTDDTVAWMSQLRDALWSHEQQQKTLLLAVARDAPFRVLDPVLRSAQEVGITQVSLLFRPSIPVAITASPDPTLQAEASAASDSTAFFKAIAVSRLSPVMAQCSGVAEAFRHMNFCEPTARCEYLRTTLSPVLAEERCAPVRKQMLAILHSMFVPWGGVPVARTARLEPGAAPITADADATWGELSQRWLLTGAETIWCSPQQPQQPPGRAAPSNVHGHVQKKRPVQVAGPGALDPQAVHRVVNTSLKRLKQCYERSLQQDPTLQGNVTVRFTVAGSGKVTITRSRLCELPDEVCDCAASTFKRLNLPPPKGGTVTFEVKLRFSPIAFP